MRRYRARHQTEGNLPRLVSSLSSNIVHQIHAPHLSGISLNESAGTASQEFVEDWMDEKERAEPFMSAPFPRYSNRPDSDCLFRTFLCRRVVVVVFFLSFFRSDFSLKLGVETYRSLELQFAVYANFVEG